MSEQAGYTTHPHFHLVSAMYNWIVENGGRPHIVVPLAEVPPQIYHLGNLEKKIITLNIAPHSVGAWNFDHEFLQFRARFGGRDTPLRIRTTQIQAIFDGNDPRVFMPMADVESTPTNDDAPVAKRPSLSVVK